MRNAGILVPFCGRVELQNRRAVLLVRGGRVGQDACHRARHFAWTSCAFAHAIPVRIGRRKSHARMLETPPLRQAILPTLPVYGEFRSRARRHVGAAEQNLPRPYGGGGSMPEWSLLMAVGVSVLATPRVYLFHYCVINLTKPDIISFQCELT